MRWLLIICMALMGAPLRAGDIEITVGGFWVYSGKPELMIRKDADKIKASTWDATTMNRALDLGEKALIARNETFVHSIDKAVGSIVPPPPSLPPRISYVTYSAPCSTVPTHTLNVSWYITASVQPGAYAFCDTDGFGRKRSWIMDSGPLGPYPSQLLGLYSVRGPTQVFTDQYGRVFRCN